MDRDALQSYLRRDRRLHATWELLGETRAWVVGGWVRDRALRREPADLDLVVADDREETIDRFASALGLKAHRLGQPGRQCWLMAAPEGRAIEIPGGKGLLAGISKIEIWPLGELSLEQDVFRRDFSINAMLWQLPEGPLIDLTGGLNDLQAGRLRAIRRENLVEDPVRLLRAPRFLAGMPEFQIEEQTQRWIRELAPSLASAPAERVGSELFRICSAARPVRGLNSAEKLGLLQHCPARRRRGTVPGISAALLEFLDHGKPIAVAAHLRESFLAWIVTYLQFRTPAELSPFCWPKEHSRIALIAARDAHLALKLVGEGWRDRREAIHRWGPAFPAILALAGAEDCVGGGEAARWRRWWRQYRYYMRRPPSAELPLRVDEISRVLGLAPGPELGKAIEALRQKRMRREILSRKAAIDWLKQRGAKNPG